MRFHDISQARNQEFSGGRGGFLEQGHFDKPISYEIQCKGPVGKSCGVFFPKMLLKLHFIRKFNPQMPTKSALFCKIRALFFYFQKRAGKTSPVHPASCAPVSLGSTFIEASHKTASFSLKSFQGKSFSIFHIVPNLPFLDFS